MNIKLIISDIDGTVLDSKHQVDTKLIELMPSLKEKRIPFILSSARSPLGMASIVQELGIQNEPIACYNGALITKGDKILSQHSINQKEFISIYEFIIREFPTVSINIYSGKDWIVESFNKWVKNEARITGETPIVTNVSDFIKKEDTIIHKLLLIDESKTIQKVQKILSEMNFVETDFYLSKDNYLEVTNKCVSKKQALLELVEYYGLTLEQVMTIGDNFNDLPMIETAGLGVAMGNAPLQVKSNSNIITSSNDEHGVSQVIKQVVFTN